MVAGDGTLLGSTYTGTFVITVGNSGTVPGIRKPLGDPPVNPGIPSAPPGNGNVTLGQPPYVPPAK